MYRHIEKREITLDRMTNEIRPIYILNTVACISTCVQHRSSRLVQNEWINVIVEYQYLFNYISLFAYS